MPKDKKEHFLKRIGGIVLTDKKTDRLISKISLIISVPVIIMIIFGLSFLYQTQHEDNLEKNMGSITPVSEMNLTQKQKVQDFNYLYKTMLSSYPMLDSTTELYGINFEERKDFYLGLLKETSSDYEYLCTMTAIFGDLTSGHTFMPFPDFKELQDFGCFNNIETLRTENLHGISNYWYDTAKQAYADNQDIKYIGFRYVAGKYLNLVSTDSFNDLLGLSEGDKFRLTAINGIPASEYILNHPSIFKIQYDYERSMPYRNNILFNDSLGEKAEVTIKTDDGIVIIKDLFISCEAEYLYFHSDKLMGGMEETESSDEQPVYTYYNNDNDILYITVNDFINEDGKKINEAVKSSQSKNIIVDLRENRGGYPSYYELYLYLPIFNFDTEYSYAWYMPVSKNNKTLYKYNFWLTIDKDFVIAEKPLPFADNGKKYMCKTEDMKLDGAATDKKNVYLLVSSLTGSAADTFTAIVKDEGLGTVIGANTLGEGKAGSYFMDILPNSGLVFTYMPGKGLNADGTDNSTYGTSPDIYVTLSEDGFRKRQEIQQSGEDAYTYENRLLWDYVLNYTIELIDEENQP